MCPNKRSDVKGKAETVETPETAVSERLPAMIRRARRTRALVVAVALALGLAACTSDDSADDASSDNDASDAGAGIAPIGESTPPEYAALEIPDGRIDDAVDQLDDIAQNALDQTGVPGMAIAVVHDDEVVYAKGFGIRETGTDEAVDADTVFQLASLSKPVGATVVAGVVGDGTVSWDDEVVQYLPDFALSDPYVTEHVTIADLYSHRSGLPDHAGDLLEDLGYDRDEILSRLRYEPLAPFRAEYAYTNFGVTTGAIAAATAAGTPWEDLSEARLYEPLGMSSTSSRFADYESNPGRAVTHQRVDGEWQPGEPRDADAQSPAGGVSSTANDMAHWMRMVLADGAFEGDQVVDPDALGAMLTPQMVSNPPGTLASRAGSYGYGIGTGVDESGRVRFSHSGAFALGAATNFVMMPAENLGIVALTNGMPIGLPEAVTASFMDVVTTGEVQRDWVSLFAELFAPLFENPSALAGQEPPSDPAPAQPDDAYVATFANDYYGPAEVVASGDGLVLRLGPEALELPLTHWDGDTFSYEPPGENAVGISAVTFTIGADGRVAGVTVENLDENGLGTFTR